MLIALTVAAVATLLLTPLAISFAHARGLFDPPGPRRVHSVPTPRLGGVPIFLACLGGVAAAGVGFGGGDDDARGMLAGIAAAAALLATVGVVDDLRGMTARYKLLAQTLAGALLCAAGVHIDEIVLGPVRLALNPYLATGLTLVWVVVVINAVNLVDGLDGLAAGLALLAAGCFGVVALLGGERELAVVCAAVVAALAGFLRFNARPARIFLGDGGSMLLGGILAAVSVEAGGAGEGGALTPLALFALAVPLVDMSLAVVRRLLRGVPIFGADRNHLHHRLLDLGAGHGGAVVVLHAAGFALVAIGLLLHLVDPSLLSLLATCGIVLAGVGIILHRLGYHELGTALRHLAPAPLGSLSSIRHAIRIRDLLPELDRAASVAELNSLLDGAAAHLGLQGLRVEAETAPSQHRPLGVRGGFVVAAPYLSVPLPSPERDGPAYVLRLWSDFEPGRDTELTRVSRLLIPTLRDRWLRYGIASGASDAAIHPVRAAEGA